MTTQFCTECGSQLEPQAHFCSVCGVSVRPARKPKKAQRQQRKRRQTPPLPLLVLALGSILFIAGTLSYLLDRPAPVPPASILDVPDEHGEDGLPYPEVARISLAQAKANFDSGTAVIVDVRTSEEYAEAHIPNAISMPLQELETRYRELSKGDAIITYCS